MSDMWAIATLPFNHLYQYNPEPRLHRVVAIEGRHVWGVDPETSHLRVINDTVNDGSVRTYEVRVYESEPKARVALRAQVTNHQGLVKAEAARRAKSVAAANANREALTFTRH